MQNASDRGFVRERPHPLHACSQDGRHVGASRDARRGRSAAAAHAGAGISDTARHYCGAGHPGLAETEYHDSLFTFSFVRHPLAWWRSFWGHRMREGWIYPDHEIDSRASSENFEEFIDQVAESLPGFLTELFTRYVGEPPTTVEFVGRTEHLTGDLSSALRSAGQPFDEAALLACPPANVGDFECFPARYPRRLAAAIVRAESEVVQRFYADDPMPPWLLA